MPPVNKVSGILAGVPASVNPSGIAGGYNASSPFVPTEAVTSGTTNTYVVGWWTFTGFTGAIA